jgi:ribonuclease HII
MELHMAWIVGIDEAGYGPNLGPFVMSAVAIQVPGIDASVDLWSLLSTAVRRPGDEADDRVVVGDSKLIYSPDRGIGTLECELYPFLVAGWGGASARLRQYVSRFCNGSKSELQAETWYTGRSKLPITPLSPSIPAATSQLRCACVEQGVMFGSLQSVVVCCTRFNQLVERWGSKGAVLGHALATLIGHSLNVEPQSESVTFFIDKHGGRNTYVAMLQEALGIGAVIAHQESMDRSEYSVRGLQRETRFIFTPRADVHCFAVALASMASKYLRELLMHEFNRYWRRKVPGLKPTHGYPGDARRFYQDVRRVAAALAIPEDAMWRRR